MFAALIETLCQRLGWTLIHFVWQGLGVALALAGVLRILTRVSAHLRYALSCVSLLSMVALPLATFCAVKPTPKAYRLMAEIPASTAGTQSSPTLPELSLKGAHGQLAFSSSGSTQAARMTKSRRVGRTVEASLPYLSLLWMIGVLALCAWHMGGWIHLQQFRHTGTQEIDASAAALFDHLRHQMGLHRAVSLYASSRVYVPTVIGWIKPVVLLPISAMSALSTEQIESILAHELAHVMRQDYLVNVIQTLAEILGFYHPAVWWVSRQIRIEREHCCDDLAVQVCGNSVAYARALTHLETTRPQRGVLALAATGGSLTRRVKRLIQTPTTCQTGPTWISGVVIVLGLLAVVCPAIVVWGQTRSVQAMALHKQHNPSGENRLSTPPQSSHITAPKLATRIYDISDLVPGQAGSKEQALEANSLAQRIKEFIEPQSWYPAGGEGTCTVYAGRKLAILQRKTIHAKIESYLQLLRKKQQGGASERPIESGVASRPKPVKLVARIYDIFDLVSGQAGPKEQSLAASFFAQKLLEEVEPQSWYQAEGEGTCTVYDGKKLAVLQTRAVHEKIELHLVAIRQYGGFLDESLLPDTWTLDYKSWDQTPELDRAASLLTINTSALKTTEPSRLDASCRIRITTFSGEAVLALSNESTSEKQLLLKNAKYLMFYECAWGKHPDNVSMRSGPFLLNLTNSGRYRLTPSTHLGSGKLVGTHAGTYAVNFQSTGRFPVVTGYVYQSLPGEYRISGLSSGGYRLNGVMQHDGDNVVVRRAHARVLPGESTRMSLPPLEMGNCTLSGTIQGRPSPAQGNGSFTWYVLIRQADASPVTSCDVYESLTMDTDYVIRGRNIVQEAEDLFRFNATRLLPGTYTVTAIERFSRAGAKVQRQQSKPLVIKGGESVTLEFAL